MIVLDTHVWIWWFDDPDRLSQRARKRIQEEVNQGPIFISSISAWELTILVTRDRLALSVDAATWIERSESLPFIRFIPVDNAIAARSVTLRPPLHSDPADRMIIATALGLGATLISKDRKLRDYPHVRTLW